MEYDVDVRDADCNFNNGRNVPEIYESFLLYIYIYIYRLYTCVY